MLVIEGASQCMNKKDYENKCFSPNWLEVDLDNTNLERISDSGILEVRQYSEYNKEVRLESKRRKDLKTLLNELDEIKQSIEKAAEKQQRLANLMGFYTGKIAQ